MSSSTITYGLIFGILVICSAYFSASETAFSSLNLIRLEAKLKTNKNHHSIKLYKKYTETLSIILIANNIVNITAASISLLMFGTLNISNYIIWSTIFTTIVILIFGEFLPKVFAKRYPESFALRLSGPLFLIDFLAYPFTYIIGLFAKDKERKTTEKELISIVSKVASQGEIEKQESILIKSALKFDDTRVKSILTKWKNVDYINNNSTIGDAIRIVKNKKHTRLPVVDKKKLIGYVSIVDLVGKTSGSSIKKHIRKINFISQNMHLDDALDLVQRKRTHILAVTKNLSSKTPIGIITLEDLIENIIGEVYDETDKEREVIPVGHDEYFVNGNTNVQKVFNTIKGEVPYVKNISFTKWVITNMSLDNIKKNKITPFKYDKFTISWVERKGKVDFFQVKENE